MPPDPVHEYNQRRQARSEALAQQDRRHVSLGNARLAVALLAAVMAWFSLGRTVFSALWLLLPAAAFVLLVIAHGRILRVRSLTARSIAFYQRGLDRVEDRWMGQGETGERFLDESHPYARDLDLFGRGSLFQLLCTTRTRAGEETLARWILSPATTEEVRERHEAIRELRPWLDFREELSVLGEDVRTGVNPEALAAWGVEPPRLASRNAWGFAAVLSLLGITTLIFWAASGPAWPLLAVLLTEGVFMFKLRRELRHVIQAVERPGQDLKLLSAVLRRLERQQFTSQRLIRLQASLRIEGLPPSTRIARLNRLRELLDSRKNMIVAVIDPLVLWTVHASFAIEAWRRKSGPYLAQWLSTVGEMEALCALAGYSYEHPSDPFAEIAEESPCFDGEALAHPLLPEARAVRNDLRLDSRLLVLIVSGSNMSGKSTLLRTVGTNAVLAMAGAPVRARRLRISPFSVGASIRTLDSLQAGTSRFYAEITRLRQLVELTQQPTPLLFLLDELLQGTNSHDRSIGAQAIVRGLVERGAVGLITTHDLALAQIADALSPQGANVHFEDRIEDGRITFDYLLRPGVVQRSNALELMRSVGLLS